MQFIGTLADLLVDAGHEVHMVVLNVLPELANYTGSSKAHKIIRLDRPQNRVHDMSQLLDLKNPFLGVQNSLRGFSDMVELSAGFCEDQVGHKDLMTQLKAENYDVGIAEFYYHCSFAIFHHIGVKTSLSALAIHMIPIVNEVFGIPILSSYVPNMIWPSINGPNMNFQQRAMNFFVDTLDTLNLREYGLKLTRPIVNNAFGADFPSVKSVLKNISLIFVNSNEFFELPHPISNKVKYVGGIVKSKAKALSHDVKSILDNSKSGVVLLSFGSVTNTSKMSEQMKESYLTAFAHFPTYDFIWKLRPGDNESTMFSSTPNVHVINWFDQKAVLAHPNTKAFMTHCGLNSINEAALAGVPVIGIPLFADQLYNSAITVYKGIGEFVPIESTNEPQVLIEALNKVLTQPKYRQNAKLVQKKLQLNPFKPEENFVKWVEFAAEFPELNELNLPSDELGL
uniref:UDP-glucuronosyltransferase n=1 Tax=Ditylenchus dipsaci TaxID=166011 RepID=A0A915DBH7_9BILA